MRRQWKVRQLTAQERSELLQGPPELRAKQSADWDYICERRRAIARSAFARSLRSVSARTRRTLPAHGGSAHLSSRAARRAGRAHRADDAGYDGDRAALSGVESRSAHRRDSFSRFRKALGKSSARDRIHDGLRRARRTNRTHLDRTRAGQFALAKSADRRTVGAWSDLVPASEDVRLHLLHLIGAHHGEPQFGSPVQSEDTGSDGAQLHR